MRDPFDLYTENMKRGLLAFNQREFYEAHEGFEDAWRETPGPSREFYRALIQISGGFFRLTQNRPKAAIKFFNNALKWLADFPSPYMNLDTDGVKHHLRRIISKLEGGIKPQSILDTCFQPLIPIETTQ